MLLSAKIVLVKLKNLIAIAIIYDTDVEPLITGTLVVKIVFIKFFFKCHKNCLRQTP